MTPCVRVALAAGAWGTVVPEIWAFVRRAVAKIATRSHFTSVARGWDKTVGAGGTNDRGRRLPGGPSRDLVFLGPCYPARRAMATAAVRRFGEGEAVATRRARRRSASTTSRDKSMRRGNSIPRCRTRCEHSLGLK